MKTLFRILGTISALFMLAMILACGRAPTMRREGPRIEKIETKQAIEDKADEAEAGSEEGSDESSGESEDDDQDGAF